MKKRIILTAVLLLITAFMNFACVNTYSPNGITRPTRGRKTTENEDATSAEAFTFEEENGAITITGLNDTDETDIIIPSKINAMPVRAIKEYAFKGNGDLKSLTVPSGVEKIGYGILSECAGISALTLPFTGERHMTEKGANDYNFGYIFGKTAFVGGEKTMQFYHKDLSSDVELVYYYIPTALKEVKITGVSGTHIPYGAFYNCSALEKITLGKEITTVGAFAFSGVNADIVWEEPKITTVGEHAFEDYKGTTLPIPESVFEIEKKGYSACVNVKEFTIPDSVKNIDIYAFSYCYDLERVNFGRNLDKLSAETFYFCIRLKTVNLPENLKTIEDGAFDSCKALEAIEIPSKVERINANAFKNCLKLKTARFPDANGWRYYSVLTSGDEFPAETISNPSTAAKYLTDTFCDYVWEKAPR